MEVLYLCDKRACEEGCSQGFCDHTLDIRHAKNFESFNLGDRILFVERERTQDEETTDFEDGQGEQSVSSETLG